MVFMFIHRFHLASARGQHGTAELRFTVDRSGHVLSARIERGSGHPLLDEETLALIQRAQPLPRMARYGFRRPPRRKNNAGTSSVRNAG